MTLRARLAAILTTILLLTGLATAATALTASSASAGVIYGPQCSEIYDGHVIWINGIRYVCTKTYYGWWYIAYTYFCAAPGTASTAPARLCG